jgi:hypothetical protein
MGRNALVLVSNIAVFRSEGMANLDVLAKRGLAVIKRENIIYFGLVMPVVVGLVSYYVYRRWYISEPQHFLILAICIGIGLSILAAVFYKRALIDFSILHVVHIFFFGWLMPLLLKF